jgi:hypothetical protein
MSQIDVAIVTDASGRAIAEAMLAAGHHVVSLDRLCVPKTLSVLMT